MNELHIPKAKAFKSYSNIDRKFGAQVKDVLEEVGVSAFLAHDDIEVSEEWRNRIIEELNQCDIFVALFSENFIASDWAPQEVGFIVSRPEVTIIPLSIDGTTPTGFLRHIQGGNISSASSVRHWIVEPLVRLKPLQILPGLIRITGESDSFSEAEANMRLLQPLFSRFAPDEAKYLAEAAIENRQIWSARRCQQEYIPEFLRVQSDNIAPDTRRALEYQIQHDREFLK